MNKNRTGNINIINRNKMKTKKKLNETLINFVIVMRQLHFSVACGYTQSFIDIAAM